MQNEQSQAKHLVLVQTNVQQCNSYIEVVSHPILRLSVKSLFAMLALGGHSFKYILDPAFLRLQHATLAQRLLLTL